MTLCLSGHTTPETAYVVEDYPYGFRERTKKRYWVETHPRHGQRGVSQTMNPKGEKWNAPKASTYSPCFSWVVNEATGHVEPLHLSPYADEGEIAAYEALADDDSATRETIRYMRAARRASAKVTYTVTSHECSLRKDCAGCYNPDGTRIQHQTLADQARIMGALTRQELRAESNAALLG